MLANQPNRLLRFNVKALVICIFTVIGYVVPCIIMSCLHNNSSWEPKLHSDDCLTSSSSVEQSGKVVFATVLIGTPPRSIGIAITGSWCGMELWTDPLDSESAMFASERRMSYGMDVVVIGGRRVVIPVRYSYRGGDSSDNSSSTRGLGDLVAEHDHDYDDSDTGVWNGDPRNNVRGTIGICPSALVVWGIKDRYTSRCSSVCVGSCCDLGPSECDSDSIIHPTSLYGTRKHGDSPWAIRTVATAVRTGTERPVLIDPIYSIDDGHRIWSHRTSEAILCAESGYLTLSGKVVDDDDHTSTVFVGAEGCDTLATRATPDEEEMSAFRCERCFRGREFVAFACAISVMVILALRASSESCVETIEISHIIAFLVYAVSRIGTESQRKIVLLSGIPSSVIDIGMLISVVGPAVISMMVCRHKHHPNGVGTALTFISMMAAGFHASMAETEFIPRSAIGAGCSMAMVAASLISVSVFATRKMSRMGTLHLISVMIIAFVANITSFLTLTLPVVTAIIGGTIDVRLTAVSLHMCGSILPALIIISRGTR